MGRVLGILAVLVVGGFLIFRIFFWGAQVVDYVETGQQNELVSLSNSIVDVLAAATDAVEVTHDLLRRASNPDEEQHSGVLGLLSLSDTIVSDRISQARRVLDAIDLTENEEAAELVAAAKMLLDTYEAFVPLQGELRDEVLASTDFPPKLALQVDLKLTDLEVQQFSAIRDFTRVQETYLD